MIAILKTNRNYYDINEAAEDSITVAELIAELEQLNPREKVVFSNDNGYTYGYIDSSVIGRK